jgi:hypothetical protein
MNALLLDGFWSFSEGLAESVDDTRGCAQMGPG